MATWLRNQWDRAIAIVAVATGAIALLLGWIGVSGASLATEQIPYLASGGLFGLFSLGLGATAWLSADLRDEWRKLDDIHAELLAGNARAVDAVHDGGPLANGVVLAPAPAHRRPLSAGRRSG